MLEAGAVLVKEAGGKRLQGSVGQQRRPSADEGECHRVLEEADGCRAFACARSLAKLAASSLHIPPVSMPRRRSPHRRLRMRSGYVRVRAKDAEFHAILSRILFQMSAPKGEKHGKLCSIDSSVL